MLVTDGTILCLLIGTVILASFFWRPRIWLNDLPDDIQSRAAPMTAEEKTWAMKIGLFVVLTLLIGLTVTALRFDLDNGFLLVALHAYLVFQLFNLFDMVVLDWGVMLLIDPAKPPIQGTEHAPGWRDFQFHALKSLKGVVLGAPFAIVAAGIAWLIHFLIG